MIYQKLPKIKRFHQILLEKSKKMIKTDKN